MSERRPDEERWPPDGLDLDAWEPAEPPAGFADRVMSARAAELAEPTPPAPTPIWGPVLAAALSSAAATALLVAGALTLETSPAPPPSPATAPGLAAEPDGPDVVALGDEGVAVGGRAARVTWRRDGADAALFIEQPRGDVVYVMSAPTPVIVATPAARAEVTRASLLRVRVVAPEQKTVVTLLEGEGGALTNAQGAATLTPCAEVMAVQGEGPRNPGLFHDNALE